MYKRLWHLLEQSEDRLLAVQDLFASAREQYASLKATVDSGVCRWEWGSSLPRYEIDPLYFLNDSARRGRTSKKQPASIKGKYQYGFDSSGLLVVARDHSEFAGKFYEEFYVYGRSEITSYLFDYGEEKEPINCGSLLLAHGSPTSYHRHARHGTQSHVYIPEAGRVRYFCSLHAQDGRKPFGGCGEILFKGETSVELWYFQSNGSRQHFFTGDVGRYNTLAGLVRVEPSHQI